MKKKAFPKFVYLNGEWLNPEEARVSVFDRGFLFGDGVYEVISFYHGTPFLMDEHLSRLQNSLSLSGISFSLSGVEDLIKTSVEKAGLNDSHSVVYLQITRGVAPRTHIYPSDPSPTLMMYAVPFALAESIYKNITVLLAEDKRWHRCNIKTISLMGNVQASEAAERAGAQEAILHRSNMITEGSHSNFFGVKGGVLFTHPANEYILPGIIRQKVIQLAKELSITVSEEGCLVSQVSDLDEAFITGTGSEVTSVGKILNGDEMIEVSASVGKLTRRLQEAFRKITLK